MKVSELWLREWVNPPITAKELATQLTMAGLEVDSVTPVAGVFNQVRVAKVLKTAPHPQADRLTLCQVDYGHEEPLQIVCGAPNVRPGLKVALAMIGATLPNGMTIKETKLRGELSQGMLCSFSELGMGEQSEGILELPSDAPIGSDLREYMALNDTVIDIDLTPNRADCFSVLGIAREVAALNQSSLTEPNYLSPLPTHGETLTVDLNAPQACPQYYGRVIRNINPHALTPLWLTERLRRAGIRPIHPVVDVTNYVMLQLGQPMHAFNKQALEGGIQVRYSFPGETLKLLDDQEISLKENTLVIADKLKPLAIAGIMGGSESAVQSDTTDIFLESAFFNPQHLAGVARQYGLCTESSQRFERGVDPVIQLQALDMATALLLELVGGEAGPIIGAQVKASMPLPKSITFNPALVQKLTGVKVAEQDMASILDNLGLKTQTDEVPWKVTVPAHRFDIHLDVDLVEEIIRIYGYDRIEAQPMMAVVKVGLENNIEHLNQQLGCFLTARGYHEVISYSFVDPQLQTAIYPDRKGLSLLNPISSELSQMRVGLWPGLIAALIYNSHRQQSLIKLFETGVVFDTQNDELIERACIAGLISGDIGAMHWTEPTRALDFFDLKGDVQALLATLGKRQISFIPAIHPGLHPGKSAQIMWGQQALGWIGVLHPRLREELSLDHEVILFELDGEVLCHKTRPQYQKISKFPSVRRDLSFLIDETINAAQIEKAVIDAMDGTLLKSFDVFDVYLGDSVPVGKKSIAIALTLQDSNRTLVDEEVNTLIDNIVNQLHQQFAIVLRDS